MTLLQEFSLQYFYLRKPHLSIHLITTNKNDELKQKYTFLFTFITKGKKFCIFSYITANVSNNCLLFCNENHIDG